MLFITNMAKMKRIQENSLSQNLPMRRDGYMDLTIPNNINQIIGIPFLNCLP